MSFNITVPNASTSPGIFPSQNNTNFSRLKLLISGDHQFNDTLATTDGKHNQVTLITKSSFVNSVPAGTSGMIYNKLSGSNPQLLYYNGSKTYLGGTILAAVNFKYSGSGSTYDIQSQYNVSSITLESDNIYKITFTTALPDIFYIVSAIAMKVEDPATTRRPRIPQIATNTSIGASMTTTFVRLIFGNSTGVPSLVDLACVTIVSVT